MPSISEEIRERVVGRDVLDGLRVDVTKVNVYSKQFIHWIGIMITAVFASSLLTIIIWNFIAPTSKPVSARGLDNLLNAIISVNLLD